MTGIAIIGPGGVGGLLGALLTRAGHDVVSMARPETAAVLDAGGMSVHSVRFGGFTVPAVAGTVLSVPVDVCIAAPRPPRRPDCGHGPDCRRAFGVATVSCSSGHSAGRA